MNDEITLDELFELIDNNPEPLKSMLRSYLVHLMYYYGYKNLCNKLIRKVDFNE